MNTLTIFREVLREEYSFRDVDKCRFFNSEGNEITEETLILTKDKDVVYFEPSLEKPFNFANILRQYKVMDKLGQGGFGKVYRAQHIATGQLVAIKYIDITEYSKFFEGFSLPCK